MGLCAPEMQQILPVGVAFLPAGLLIARSFATATPPRAPVPGYETCYMCVSDQERVFIEHRRRGGFR
jgi:hypothetical protein